MKSHHKSSDIKLERHSHLLKAADFIKKDLSFAAPKTFSQFPLSGYAAISMLMEQKQRVFQSSKENLSKQAYAEKFAIKVFSIKNTSHDSMESKMINQELKESSLIKVSKGADYIEVQKFPKNHTLNIDKYLKYRLPQTIVDLAATTNVLIWADTCEEMQAYLKINRIHLSDEIRAQNTLKFYLAEKEEVNPILIISGLSSVANLYHILLQLHYKNVDLNKVEILGNIQTVKSNAYQALTTCLEKLVDPSADDRILFIGAKGSTLQVLKHPSKRLVPHEINDSFEFFDHHIIDNLGKKIQVFILKMPRGDAAYDATKAFIQQGIKKIIMTGAGGALSADGDIGDYVLINEAEYRGEVIKLKPEQLVSVQNCTYVNSLWTKNVTVDSPLNETKAWYESYKKHGCVDVETFHIFKAINEVSDVKVIPGFFISDLVDKIPLADALIGMPELYKNIPDFSLKTLALMSSLKNDKKVIHVVEQESHFNKLKSSLFDGIKEYKLYYPGKSTKKLEFLLKTTQEIASRDVNDKVKLNLLMQFIHFEIQSLNNFVGLRLLFPNFKYVYVKALGLLPHDVLSSFSAQEYRQ